MALFQQAYKLSGRPVLIRNAEPEDAPALIALIRRYDEETPFLSREPGEFDMTEEQERAYIETQRSKANSLLLVAEVAGRPVGSLGATFGENFRTRHTGQIGIAIEKAHWGMGIGKALMGSALSWLKENEVERVVLTVDTENLRAISLYMGFGFIVEGRHERERKLINGTYRDSYAMSLRLQDRA